MGGAVGSLLDLPGPGIRKVSKIWQSRELYIARWISPLNSYVPLAVAPEKISLSVTTHFRLSSKKIKKYYIFVPFELRPTHDMWSISIIQRCFPSLTCSCPKPSWYEIHDRILDIIRDSWSYNQSHLIMGAVSIYQMLWWILVVQY